MSFVGIEPVCEKNSCFYTQFCCSEQCWDHNVEINIIKKIITLIRSLFI